MNIQVNKIINDPIYGFITFNEGIFLQVIDHPFFQRLSRIKQLGLTYLVYPGAHHTRFQHAIGSAYLMKQALQTLKSQGRDISKEEEIGVILAILLHDIGHGPFSHALENSFIKNINHEEVSLIFMKHLNNYFKGSLEIAIEIFTNKYSKGYLHKLVSSQLDMDRLDYLKRDSFFTGVSEGVVSNQRIIKMFDVHNDDIVIREKGIYSIEKFIIARRLMYWQVYLHKTVLSAEFLVEQIISRARELIISGEKLFTTDELKLFLSTNITGTELYNFDYLDAFSKIDDYDIFSCIKSWCKCDDRVLSLLSQMLTNRNLPKVKISSEPFSREYINELKSLHKEKLKFSENDVTYIVYQKEMENSAYDPKKNEIKILYKNGSLKDVTEASDNLNIRALSKVVKKYYLFSPSF